MKMIRPLLGLAERFPLAHRYYRGMASIIALHRVGEADPSRLPFNEEMKISPLVLENLILSLKARGHQFISIDALWRHLVEGRPVEKAVVFSLDDGYLDNYTQAYPLFKKHGVPFTLYLTSSFPDQTAKMWWFALEDLLLSSDEIRLSNGQVFDASTQQDKVDTFLAIRRLMLSPSAEGCQACVAELFNDHAVDWLAYSQQHALGWEQVLALSEDPLVTIGGHTVSHASLAQLTEVELVQDVSGAHERITAVTGQKVEHFAYPFGGRKEANAREFSLLKRLGLKTAVTTRRGNIFPAHKDYLTSLPRINFDNSVGLSILGRPTYPRLVTA
jgi:peptidoglycan/xylan/chitin deacetylase (PgdA/CDA1 family)